MTKEFARFNMEQLAGILAEGRNIPVSEATQIVFDVRCSECGNYVFDAQHEFVHLGYKAGEALVLCGECALKRQFRQLKIIDLNSGLSIGRVLETLLAGRPRVKQMIVPEIPFQTGSNARRKRRLLHRRSPALLVAMSR